MLTLLAPLELLPPGPALEPEPLVEEAPMSPAHNTSGESLEVEEQKRASFAVTETLYRGGSQQDDKFIYKGTHSCIHYYGLACAGPHKTSSKFFPVKQHWCKAGCSDGPATIEKMPTWAPQARSDRT